MLLLPATGLRPLGRVSPPTVSTLRGLFGGPERVWTQLPSPRGAWAGLAPVGGRLLPRRGRVSGLWVGGGCKGVRLSFSEGGSSYYLKSLPLFHCIKFSQWPAEVGLLLAPCEGGKSLRSKEVEFAFEKSRTLGGVGGGY